MVSIIFFIAALITAHRYSLKDLWVELVARESFSKNRAALTLGSVILLFLFIASIERHMGQGQMMPGWYTKDQSDIFWLGRSCQSQNLALGRWASSFSRDRSQTRASAGRVRKHKLAQTLEIQVSWFSWEGPNAYVFSFILVLLNSAAIFSQLYRKPDWLLRISKFCKANS